MIIEVKTYGLLDDNITKDVLNVEVHDQATVEDAILKLGLDNNTALTYVVNNKKVNLQTSLNEGDELKIIPIVGGG